MKYSKIDWDKRQKACDFSQAFSYMARMEGVEPPTAWFVARYSIQLSYMRVIFSRPVKGAVLSFSN